jgi:hypothetical protein
MHQTLCASFQKLFFDYRLLPFVASYRSIYILLDAGVISLAGLPCLMELCVEGVVFTSNNFYHHRHHQHQKQLHQQQHSFSNMFIFLPVAECYRVSVHARERVLGPLVKRTSDY